MQTKTDESFEALLRYMRDSRGFDFTGYKRTTLMRHAGSKVALGGGPVCLFGALQRFDGPQPCALCSVSTGRQTRRKLGSALLQLICPPTRGLSAGGGGVPIRRPLRSRRHQAG